MSKATVQHEGITAADLAKLIAAQDAIWLTALGFKLVEAKVLGGQAWYNTELKLSYPIGKALDVSNVVRSVLYATERKQQSEAQANLREALFDALGLSIGDIHMSRDDGYGGSYEVSVADGVVRLD